MLGLSAQGAECLVTPGEVSGSEMAARPPRCRGKKGPQAQPPPRRKAGLPPGPTGLHPPQPASSTGRPFTSCGSVSRRRISERCWPARPGPASPSRVWLGKRWWIATQAPSTHPAQRYVLVQPCGQVPLPANKRETRTSRVMKPLVPGPGRCKRHSGSFPGLCRLHLLPAPLQSVTGEFREAMRGARPCWPRLTAQPPKPLQGPGVSRADAAGPWLGLTPPHTRW